MFGRRRRGPEPVRFEKWEGLGNDFVVVADDVPFMPRWEAIAPKVCDRHFGVGADGVIVLTLIPPGMHVVNADGSVPEMCGNGLRCVVAALADREGIDVGETWFDTAAGPRRARFRRTGPVSFDVTVNMGEPSFDPSLAGVHGVASTGHPVVLHADGVGDGYVVSIGNPHWIFVEPDPTLDVGDIGPGLEHDARFASRTNVEFVHRKGPAHWTVDVWERGAGRTLACGSGAVSVARLLVALGREAARTAITIELPGGPLVCEVGPNGAVAMTGPACRTMRGELDDDVLRAWGEPQLTAMG